MAARRVADRGDPAQVERRADIGQVVDGGGDVGAGLGPAAARPEADAPVLDVPRGPSALGEIGNESVHEVAVVPPAPAAAVDEHDDRVRPGAVGEQQLTDLARMLAVAVARAPHAGRAENGTATGAGSSG